MESDQGFVDDASTIRRLNLETLLGHGDLKLLAEKLDKNANYLSQTFSLKCKRPLTSKLARKIEHALGIDSGTLDRDPEEINIEAEREEENHRAEQEVQHVYASNKMSALAFELLEERLKKIRPNSIVSTNENITFDEQVYTVPIFIRGIDNTPLLVVETARSKAGLARMLSQKNLLSSMAITGCRHGLIATETGGQLLENWFVSVNGKIEPISSKPKF